MGGKGGGPNPPDYIGAAAEQGEQNRQTFLEGLSATRINQTNPFGSQSWVYTGPERGPAPTWEAYQSLIGKPIRDANGQLVEELVSAQGGRTGSYGWADDEIKGGFQNAINNLPYSEEQARKDYEDALRRYNTGTTAPGAWTLQTTLSPEMQKIYDTGYGAYINAANKLAGTQLDESKLIPKSDWSRLTTALGGDGTNYTDAYYNKATRLLGDKYSQEEQALRSQLLNSGLSEGTEAYDTQFRNWMDAKNRNYADIADQSILTGSTLRNQDIQSLVSALTAQDQARGADLQQQSYLRNLPLADAQMILQGLQVPQFGGGQGGGGGGGWQGGDYMSAVQNQFGADLDQWNANQAQRQNTANTAISLATLAYLASDRRLKTNIKPTDRKTSKGFNIYSYEKYGVPEIGVMADEVQLVLPEAVVEMPSGYLAVDYSKVGSF